MKDFDSEWSERKSVDARTFRFLGESFVLKTGVRPEALGGREDLDPENTTVEESMASMDDLFLLMIEHGDDAEKRYREIRAREENALGVADLNEVIDWMIEKQTGRPPTLRDASQPGPRRTGTRSTGVSSSRASTAA